MPVTLVKSKWSSGNLIFYEDPAKAGGQIRFGEDGSGLDVKLFGATSGCYMEWDEANDIANIVRTSEAITGTIGSLAITQTMTGAGTGQIAAPLKVTTNANVKVGNICAVYSYVDLKTDGCVQGQASAVVAEMVMPGSTIVTGTYVAFDAELGFPANCSMGNQKVVILNVVGYGDNKTVLDNIGYLFELAGLTSGASSMWYDNQKTPAPAIEEFVRVKTPKGTRYLGLYNANA